MSEARDSAQEELPRVRGQGQQPRGATRCPRPGVVAWRSHHAPKARGSGREDQPHVQGVVAAWAQVPTLKVRKGGGEETPLIQGKEQWLCFAGAAVKRYPTPKVRETKVRW